MQNVAEILPSRVKERLDIMGKTMRGVSLAIGAHAGYVRDLFDPERFNVPSSVRLHALAAELETTSEWLLGETSDPSQVRSEVGLSDKHVDWITPDRSEPGIPLMGTGDCAEIELCSESGELVAVERASFDDDYPVRMIARPPALRGARDLYAIHFVGESMEPRYESGEVAIVNPRRPVNRGDYVLVQLNSGSDDAVNTVLAKRLVGQNAKELVLEQFNPPLTFIVPKSRVARIHYIMPQTELLFG